ncbi:MULTISPECIES: pilin [unclassified Francisella]|uniref:pilin n=1 Tax=unclassified Francisella TaxID=2610885 RepID=UPI002E330605|nr:MULTISPECIES: pilin [unclassified Francisella]MED7819365.1 pilin [Francisella sp. 19S2-4]MED7830178.1 pilin [Francisella sp. 19S2-10]
MKTNKGFSLVELMVVIAIIAILAAIAIPMYSAYTTRAKIADILGQEDPVKQQVYDYILENGNTLNLSDSDFENLPSGSVSGTSYSTYWNASADAIYITIADYGSIVLTPQYSVTANNMATGATINWVCSNTFLNSQKSYLPSNCR